MCCVQQPFHEGDNEFHSILDCACRAQTLTPFLLLGLMPQSELLFHLFVEGGCLFLFLCKWRLMGWVDWQMQKLKLDILVLCLLSQAATVIYLYVKVALCMMSLSYGGNYILNSCGKKPDYPDHII